MKLILLLCACTTAAHGSSLIKLVVKEDKDVVLPCSVEFSAEHEVFDWKKVGATDIFFYQKGTYNNFGGRAFHFPDKLSSGNASVVIRGAQVADGGNYTCNFPYKPPSRRAQVQVIVEPVLKARTVPGAARWPTITLHEASVGVLLNCFVLEAFPKPELRWLDASGQELPAEEPEVSFKDDHYDVVLKTTVRESGHYSCEVTQREIHHRNHTKTYVPVPEPLTTKVTLGVLLGLVGVAAIIASAVYIYKRCKKGQRFDAVHRVDGPSVS